MKNILFSKDIYEFFKNNNYKLINPFNIVNNKDGNISNNQKVFIAQPVIRTQYLNSLDEGISLAFINGTTSSFNLTQNEYEKLVSDWLDFFYQIGLKKQNISTSHDFYEDNWNNISLSGNRTFYYYNNIEIGDTTFFTKVNSNKIETMCDLGFGIERLRWCISSDSYYNLYSDSKELLAREKALISAISLLAVCNVKPSHKNSGYRARLFSKELAKLLDGKKLTELEINYLKECIEYWKDWQKVDFKVEDSLIINEYERNCNSKIINLLVNEGYDVGKININITLDDMKKRLYSAGVSKERIKRIIR